MGWTHLSEDRNKWYALVRIEMNVQVAYKIENFLKE